MPAAARTAMRASSPYVVSFDAPLETLDLRLLKQFRDHVVGSRTHKAQCVAKGRVPECVALLRRNDATDEVKHVVARILGSLAANTQASILLAVCRADAIAVLFENLAQQAQRWSHGEESSSALVLVDAYISALKHIFKALADVAGSRTDRAARDGGNTMQSSIPRSSIPNAGTSSYSFREERGWHLAEAGFALQDGQLHFPSPLDPYKTRATVSLTPERELVLRARHAIDAAFSTETMHLWVGALFMARIPRHYQQTSGTTSGRVTASNSRVASAANSRSATRPASPVIAGDASRHLSAASSRSSSRLSLISDSHSRLAASGPQRKEQDLVLQVYDGVCEMLRDILSIPCDKGTRGDSPAKVLWRRRKELVAMRAEDSLFFKEARSTERGRSIESEEFQADFVRRGTSRDARHQQMEVEHDVEDVPTTIDPQTSVLQALFDAVCCGRAKTQALALDALAELCRESGDISRAICAMRDDDAGEAASTTIYNLRTSGSVPLKISALSCLVHIHKAVMHSTKTHLTILQGLMTLCTSRTPAQIRAMLTIAELLSDSPDLQRTAAQHGCIEDLTKVLLETKNSPQIEERSNLEMTAFTTPKYADAVDACLREANLRALAALCLHHDDVRRRFVDQTPSPLGTVVQSLTAARVGVRTAACTLVRSLSRSVSILRTSLVDAGMAGKLLALLQDDEEVSEVKCEVLAALCNMVLKFSPVRRMLIEGDGIRRITALAHSSDALLRLNALWAVRNSLYYASSAQKVTILNCLGWDVVKREARSSDIDIQCEALGILRNLTNNTDGSDVETMLRSFANPDELFAILETVIWQRRSQDCVEQAAYILVNIAASDDTHRALILDRSNLLDALVFFLNFPRPGVRVAGIWAIHNLTQSSAGGSMPLPEAMARLLKFSFNVRLRELVEDPERDVSDRAKSLLQRLSPLAAA